MASSRCPARTRRARSSSSEGQQSLASATPASPFKDDSSLDVRRAPVAVQLLREGPAGPHGRDAVARVLEIDFCGGFGGGNYGNVSLLNRACGSPYSELNWGNHRLQFGQQNDLIFAMAPTSLSHIGFPLGYFTGNTGWRRPGIFGFHNLPVEQGPEGRVRLGGRPQPVDRHRGAANGGDVRQLRRRPQPRRGVGRSGGRGSPHAQLRQGRSPRWVAGHYNQVDLTGVGNDAGRRSSSRDHGHVVQRRREAHARR